MGKKKESFIIYHDWEDALSGLSDEQLGMFLRAVFAYEKRGEDYTGADSAVKMAMSFARGALDRNRKKYAEKCEQNRINGAKGGAPAGNQNAKKQPKQPKTTENNPNQAKQPDNEPEHEHEHEHEHDREQEREPEHEHDASGDGSGLFPFPFAQSDLDLFVGELTGAGIPVDDAAKQQLTGWLRRYGFGLVEVAVGEAIQRKARKFRYLEGIVRNWVRAGVDTGDKAAAYLIKTGVWSDETN